MIIFLSDIHLGRGDRTADRDREADLLACLRAHQDEVEALYLVGDVFDEYIEYKTLVPKGYVRFLALLAEWTDRGVPITYLVGNHDPWHRDYFSQELGVRVIFDEWTAVHHDHTVYLTHGDALPGSKGWYRHLKPVLRHPLPVWLYRSLLPGDTGFRLARWMNRRFHSEALKPSTKRLLHAHALRLLTDTPADIVVMGHSHQPVLETLSRGLYLNLGAWAYGRTFGTLCNDGLTLLRWDGERSIVMERSALPGS